MNASAKRFLFLVRHPPVAGAKVHETLDMILTCAAFDQFVSVLFLDDGVLQLVGPSAEARRPPWQSMVKALELYDIRQILVEAESLQLRGLGEDDLALAAAVVSADNVKQLLAGHDRVVVC